MSLFFFFFFNDTATTEIYTLSLHDALPICSTTGIGRRPAATSIGRWPSIPAIQMRTCSTGGTSRSEEHTSELQSQSNLVCRLLLEKKKNLRTAAPPLFTLRVDVARQRPCRG